MSRILAVLTRELRAYFDSIIAYVILLAFYGVTSWLTMGSLLRSNQASLRSFFDLLPVMFLLFVPALAMRLWSEERKLGTIELLMTWPLRAWDIVLGKFLAGLALIAVALASTLTFAVYISWYGEPDIGPLIGGYLAALLLGASYLAISCFVSALTENQIVAFVGSVFCCTLLYLAGLSGVLSRIPEVWTTSYFELPLGWLVTALSSIGLGARFASVARGVVDLSDLVFYLALMSVFLFLNVRAVTWQAVHSGGSSNRLIPIALLGLAWAGGLALVTGHWLVGGGFLAALYFYFKSVKAPGPRRWIERYLDMVISAFLAVLIAVQVCGIADQLRWRWDLTDERAFSLTELSRRVARDMEDPLSIRCYFSGSMPPAWALRKQRTVDMLQEYASASEGKISLRFLDPDTDPEISDIAQREGVAAQPLPVRGKTEIALVKRFFGCVLEYRDRKEVFAFMPDLNRLELEMTAAMRSLEVPTNQTIGFLMPKGEVSQGMRQIEDLVRRRRLKLVEVKNLDKGAKVPSNVTALLVIRPSKLSQREAYEIDQFVMRGGSLLAFVDGADMDNQLQGVRVVSGLENVLYSYGFEVKRELIRDDGRGMHLEIAFNIKNRLVRGPNPYAFGISKAELAPEHPITKYLPGLAFPHASPIVVHTKRGEVTTLAKGSPTSSSTGRLSFLYNQIQYFIEKKKDAWTPAEDELRSPTIAIAYRGPLDSAFQGQRPPEPEKGVAPSDDEARETLGETEKGQMVLVGDSGFIRPRAFGPYGLPGRRGLSKGLAFVLNAIDWIIADEELIKLHSRGLKARKLSFPEDVSQSQLVLPVYAAVPLLLLLIGCARWFALMAKNRGVAGELRRALEEPWERPPGLGGKPGTGHSASPGQAVKPDAGPGDEVGSDVSSSNESEAVVKGSGTSESSQSPASEVEAASKEPGAAQGGLEPRSEEPEPAEAIKAIASDGPQKKTKGRGKSKGKAKGRKKK